MRWFLLCVLGLILFTNRALYFSRFDEAYWKDRYEQSQWQLPMSVRTIGDDGLYLYTGYRLVRGDNPAGYNPEVPPLGKYLIGASILFFGNGYWYGFITTGAALVLFSLLARTLLKHSVLSLALTLIVAVDPLIASQFSLTMLDSLQLALLLLFFLALSWKNHVVAGAAVGLFSGTKFPLLTPILVYIGIASYWRLEKSRWKYITIFLISAAVCYMLPYFKYFLSGHTMIDWLRIQKGIMSFYTKSLLAPNTGSAITTLLVNRIQNLFTKSWELSSQWSIAWPIITLLSAYASLRRNRLPHIPWFIFGALLLFSVVPFWTRYLIVILPFLYLATGKLLIDIKKPILSTLIFLLLFTANALATYPILFPLPATTIQQFTYDWQHGFFQDMYERLTSESKLTVSRDAFHRFGKIIYYEGEIESVTIDRASEKLFTFTYHTRRLGDFTENIALPVVRENGQWRVDWNWNMLIAGLAPDYHLETKVQEAKRGTIRDKKNTAIAYDAPGSMIWVTPKNIDITKEKELLKLLSSLFPNNLPEVRIHHRYVGNTLADAPIPIGVTALDIRTVALYSGISFTPAFARWYNSKSPVDVGKLKNTKYEECCSWLYTTTTYDGVSGLEATYNDTLKGENGGTLVLKDADGQIIRELIRKDKHDGNNIQLPY